MICWHEIAVNRDESISITVSEMREGKGKGKGFLLSTRHYVFKFLHFIYYLYISFLFMKKQVQQV